MSKTTILLLLVIAIWMALILPTVGFSALSASGPTEVTCQTEDHTYVTFVASAVVAKAVDARPSCWYGGIRHGNVVAANEG